MLHRGRRSAAMPGDAQPAIARSHCRGAPASVLQSWVETKTVATAHASVSAKPAVRITRVGLVVVMLRRDRPHSDWKAARARHLTQHWAMTAAAAAEDRLLAAARKRAASIEKLLWMIPSEAPKALQTSECSGLLDPMRASCWIAAQH